MTTFFKCNANNRSKNSNKFTVSLLMPYKKAQFIENEFMRTFPENLKNELKHSWKLFTHSDLIYAFVRNEEIKNAIINPALTNLNIDYANLDLNRISIQNIEVISRKRAFNKFFNLKVVLEVTIILFDSIPVSRVINQSTNNNDRPITYKRNFILINGGKA